MNGEIVKVDEGKIQDYLGEMVRNTVEGTLNTMLDAEADRLCGADRYQRSTARGDTRAGSYSRSLQTSAGKVELKVPKLRKLTFETAIIERYTGQSNDCPVFPIVKVCLIKELSGEVPDKPEAMEYTNVGRVAWRKP